jgi:hypothetical protein
MPELDAAVCRSARLPIAFKPAGSMWEAEAVEGVDDGACER